MKISFKGDYALKAILYLALHYDDSKVQITDVAKYQDIPQQYLSQIMLVLKGAGYIQSRRGPAGGYWLAKPPQRITLGEIIRLMDGPTSPIGCVSRSGYVKCNDEPDCPFKEYWIQIRECVNKVVDNTTFEDLRQKVQRQKEASSFAYQI